MILFERIGLIIFEIIKKEHIMLKIKKLSMLILMFSACYIFSSIGEFGAGGFGKDIAAFQESQTKKLEWLKSEVASLYTTVRLMIAEGKIDTPKYHEKVEELRNVQQKLMEFQKLLGINTETWLESDLRLIPRDKQYVHDDAKKLDKILQKEKIIKYVLGMPSTPPPAVKIPQITSTSASNVLTAKSHEMEYGDKVKNPAKNWNFEIQNKFPGKVQIYIKNDHGQLKTSASLGTTTQDKKIRIAQVNVKDGFIITAKEADKIDGQKIIIYIDSNNTRETIYLTIAKDKEGSLKAYLQSGTFMGLSGKTDSGLSLDKSKNVQAKDISLRK